MLRIGSDDFESKVINSTTPVLIEFYSDSCIACKMLSPILSEIEEEYSGKLEFYKVNAVFDAELARKYKVFSAPTLVLFENGKIKRQAGGAIKKEELVELIEKN